MHLRRTTALSVGSLLLAAPLLSSCGFNYATDRPNTVAAGANNRDGAVDVLGAVIVSSYHAKQAAEHVGTTAVLPAPAGGLSFA